VALARLGDSGVPVLEKPLDTGSIQTKRIIMVSVVNAITPQAARLIAKGIKDPNPASTRNFDQS